MNRFHEMNNIVNNIVAEKKDLVERIYHSSFIHTQQQIDDKLLMVNQLVVGSDNIELIYEWGKFCQWRKEYYNLRPRCASDPSTPIDVPEYVVTDNRYVVYDDENYYHSYLLSQLDPITSLLVDSIKFNSLFVTILLYKYNHYVFNHIEYVLRSIQGDSIKSFYPVHLMINHIIDDDNVDMLKWFDMEFSHEYHHDRHFTFIVDRDFLRGVIVKAMKKESNGIITHLMNMDITIINKDIAPHLLEYASKNNLFTILKQILMAHKFTEGIVRSMMFITTDIRCRNLLKKHHYDNFSYNVFKKIKYGIKAD